MKTATEIARAVFRERHPDRYLNPHQPLTPYEMFESAIEAVRRAQLEAIDAALLELDNARWGQQGLRLAERVDGSPAALAYGHKKVSALKRRCEFAGD